MPLMEEEKSDRYIKCVDCNTEFIFTSSEQGFFQQKGFNDPKRCKPCRDERKQRARSQGN